MVAVRRNLLHQNKAELSSNDQVDGADYEVISGGASSIADEDISEAKDKLNQLVEELSTADEEECESCAI